MLGQGSVSEAGGFLRRMFGRNEGRTTAFAPAIVRNRSAATVRSTTNSGADSRDAVATKSVLGIPQSKTRERGQIVHVPLSAEQTYERNCKACEAVYADADKQKKCKEIAKSILEKMSQKDYVAYTPPPKPCACTQPEFPTIETCLITYELDIQSPDLQVRSCAAECFMSCILSTYARLQSNESP